MTAAPTAGGVVTSGVGVAGVGVGLLGMFGPVRVVHVGWLLPLSGVHIELDRLGGFFMALTGAVAAPVGCYLIGYVRREHLGRVPMAVVPLFVAAMLLVPAAGSVTTFLLAWELMAIASLILVLSEHARPQVRSAGLWYAVMTQLGFIAILVGLVVLAAAGGSDRFAGLGAVCDGVRAAVFMLTLVGFGSKAGLVPLHAWLPRAHPEAPSPVSALMSAAMVNLGIYGIVRFDLQLLGPGPRWWGLALLAVGGTSALYGVLQASVAADLKRLLAYSTTENMGLITLALGAATLFADTGAYGPASIAAAAAMLHMIAHAAFKSLAFMAAGSVLAATGLRDLDLLGGLARRMPATTVFFGVAALGACGLPLGAGFVSEWLLVQSLIHAAPGHDPIVALTTPLAVGVVALATGLSVAAMTKAFGIGFLARPRSTQAEAAREAPASMRAGMAIAAGACLVLAVAPLLVAPMVRRAAATLPAAQAVKFTGLGAVVRLPAMSGSIAPGVIAAAVLAAALAVAVLARWRFRRRPAPARLPLWACGAADLTVRMQYTATSFAEPLQRVFGDVLRPDRHRHRGHPHRRVALYGRADHLPDRGRRRDRTAPLYAGGRGGGRHGRAAAPCPHRQRAPLPGLRRAGRTDRAGGREVNVMSYLAGAAQIGGVMVGAPLVIGMTRQVRARWEGRAGAGLLQPWRDLLKQLGKQQITPAGTTIVFAAAPVIVAGTTLLIAAIAPLVATGSPLDPSADLFAVVGLLFLGTVALTLAGIDTGTSFGGMGASREITIAALVEPTILLAVFALSIPAGSANLGALVASTIDHPGHVVSLAGVLAFVALVIVIVAETGRLPVDNPATHLELTMVHEAMVLEYAGPRLALVEWAAGMRLTVLLALLANLFLPWGIAGAAPTALDVLTGVVAVAAKVAILAVLLATFEVFLAKLRLFRVPELLAGSFLLALLAVTAANFFTVGA